MPRPLVTASRSGPRQGDGSVAAAREEPTGHTGRVTNGFWVPQTAQNTSSGRGQFVTMGAGREEGHDLDNGLGAARPGRDARSSSWAWASASAVLTGSPAATNTSARRITAASSARSGSSGAP